MPCRDRKRCTDSSALRSGGDHNLPQTPGSRPSFHVARAGGVDQDEEALPLEAPFARPRAGLRKGGGIASREARATRTEWTAIALRRCGSANGRSQVHDGLGVFRHALRWGVFVGQPPEFAQGGRGGGRSGNPVVARQHALDVAIENDRAPAVRLGDDGGRGGTADPRQRHQALQGVRQNALVLADHQLRAAMQMASPAVVAKAAPEVQHFVEIRLRQSGHVRETRHESIEVAGDRCRLGLLQHDLRDPNPIRSAAMLPRHVLAARAFPPCEQALGEISRSGAARGLGRGLWRRRHLLGFAASTDVGRDSMRAEIGS